MVLKRFTPKKTPLFFSPPPQEVLWSTGSIIDPWDILSGKEQKMSQLFSNNYGSNNNYGSFNTTYVNYLVADDRSNILAWLSPLDPRSRHQGIRDRRIESVGEWVLQTREFRSWYAGSEDGESDGAVLFCYGNPGVGKTFVR